MKTKHISIVVLACAALFAVAGCKVRTFGNSVLTASSGGRDVHVSADGPAWVQAQEDHITVKLTGHEIAIDKERLLVDKKECAKVAAEAKKFDVTAADGTLTVTADGAEILKTPLK